MYKLLQVLLAVLIQRVAAWLLLVTVIRDNDNLVCYGVVFLPLRVRGFLFSLDWATWGRRERAEAPGVPCAP